MDGATRRQVLSGVALGMLSVAGCVGSATTESAESDRPAFDGWLANTAAYEGVVDRTDQSTVTVGVGGDDGLSFDPPAIRIGPGTSVRWEWTGGGAAHNVVAEDRSFESAIHTEAGQIFEQDFDTDGVVKYLCVPHEYAGMKGVIVVET